MFARSNLEVQHTHTFTSTLAMGCQIEGKGMCGSNESLARSQELYEVPEVSPDWGETTVIHNPVTLMIVGRLTRSLQLQCIFHQREEKNTLRRS